MPHLFMHIQQGATLIMDPEGEHMLSLDEARQKAFVSARELMSQKVLHGRRPNGDKFVIVDEDGRVVLVVPFKDAIG